MSKISKPEGPRNSRGLSLSHTEGLNAWGDPKDPHHNHGADWIKWIAISTMFLDHLTLGAPELAILVFPGRMAMPLFALLCGWIAVAYTRNRILYLARIARWSIPTYFFVNLFWPLPQGAGEVLILLAIGIGLYEIFSPHKPLQIVTHYDYLEKSTLGGLLLGLAWIIPGYGPVVPLLVCCGTLAASQKQKTGKVEKTTIVLSCLLAIGSIPNWNEWMAYPWMGGTILLILTLTPLFFFWLIQKPKMRPCPAPNTRFLYFSYPASYIPPLIPRI